MSDLRRGAVFWADLDSARGREQAGRRPVLIIASDAYLAQTRSLAIVLPATTTDRGWPNHIRLAGRRLDLARPTFAMTEQPRTITRERLEESAGFVNAATMSAVDVWLRDFLGFH